MSEASDRSRGNRSGAAGAPMLIIARPSALPECQQPAAGCQTFLGDLIGTAGLEPGQPWVQETAVQGPREVLSYRRLDRIAEMCAKLALPDEGRGTSWASWRTDRLEAGPTSLTWGRTKDQFLR
jgi:hypothetical protein